MSVCPRFLTPYESRAHAQLGRENAPKSCQTDADAIATKHLDLDEFVVHNEIQLPMEVDVFTLLDPRGPTL